VPNRESGWSETPTLRWNSSRGQGEAEQWDGDDDFAHFATEPHTWVLTKLGWYSLSGLC